MDKGSPIGRIGKEFDNDIDADIEEVIAQAPRPISKWIEMMETTVPGQ